MREITKMTIDNREGIQNIHRKRRRKQNRHKNSMKSKNQQRKSMFLKIVKTKKNLNLNKIEIIINNFKERRRKIKVEKIIQKKEKK